MIGVISDSHDNLPLLKKTIQELLEHRVELIIHLGDIISPFVVRQLAEIVKNTPVVAVRGNNDGDIQQLKTLFDKYGWLFYSEPTIIEVENRKFLLMHGYNGIEFTESIARALLRSLSVDGVFYGHTHRYVLEEENNRILLNPGEVCGYLTGKSTYAILDTGSLKTQIHFLGV